ncbi:ssDNA endonuclease and repair protein rad10 [Curvularia kusanoi]|uniref:SsDNA endonuclease and repair protein rad10 n=1 Tax=Curvularia kusanoi TaxID=90978 RepID=A0A9P4TC03_CURKU|nr:ssDNA endonuclease and repair protein rad10 [Curvularia kusanoi]
MCLHSLPAEVQIQVFSYLEVPTLKAVRRVCRAFRDNAEPTLFQYVIAAARYQPLGAFQKISLFEPFQKHVREIVFDGSIYNAQFAMHEPSYHREAAARYTSLDRGFTYHKHDRWKRYAQLYKEQQEMQTDGILLHTFSRALEWIPNVCCITFSPFPRHLPSERKDTQELLPRGLRSSPPRGFTKASHPFRQLIAALYVSQFAGIRKLRTEAIGTRPGVEFALSIFDLDDQEMEAAKYLFRHLESLELSMAIWVHDITAFNTIIDKFITLLHTSTDLRHLHLHPTRWKSRDEFYPPRFTRLGLQGTWAKLQSFSLKELDADSSEFSDLIKRHRSTLVSVTLCSCGLDEGFWADIVDEVICDTEIEKFVLDCVHERHQPEPVSYPLSSSMFECWKYEGQLEVTDEGDRYFAERIQGKKSVYDSRNRRTEASNLD